MNRMSAVLQSDSVAEICENPLLGGNDCLNGNCNTKFRAYFEARS